MVCWTEKSNWSLGLNMPKIGSIFFPSVLADLLFSLYLILELAAPNHPGLKSRILNTFDTALSHQPHIIKVQMLSIWPSLHLSVHAFLIIPTPFLRFRKLWLDCFKSYNFKHNKLFKTRGGKISHNPRTPELSHNYNLNLVHFSNAFFREYDYIIYLIDYFLYS